MIDDFKLRSVLLKSIRDAVRVAPENEPFLLASGKTSRSYVDLRHAILKNGLFMHYASLALMRILHPEVDAIGGVPTAGLMLMGGMLAVDGEDTESLSGFYTRLEPKKHGMGTQVEGLPVFGTACLVEDTVTTGKSLIEHADIARANGVDVRFAVALLDRDEGAHEALIRHGITLRTVFTIHDLADD
jgi:orotate phosphoribosyltransferase